MLATGRTGSLSTRVCLALALCGWLCTTACIVGDKCDAHQHEAEEATLRTCVCDPGYVLSARGYGCDKCGEHEEVVDGKCACASGYRRASNAACEPDEGTPSGAPCTSSESCGAPNPYCATGDGAGYCTTQGCSVNDDCPTQWRCAADANGAFCRKPPSSLGKSCESNADCTDPDAAYCEAFSTHTCIISDCLRTPSRCVSQTVCCDLSSLINESLCVPTDSLTGGKCFNGTNPVAP